MTECLAGSRAIKVDQAGQQDPGRGERNSYLQTMGVPRRQRDAGINNSSESGERNFMGAAGSPHNRGRKVELGHDNYHERQCDQKQDDELHPAVHRYILT